MQRAVDLVHSIERGGPFGPNTERHRRAAAKGFARRAAERAGADVGLHGRRSGDALGIERRRALARDDRLLRHRLGLHPTRQGPFDRVEHALVRGGLCFADGFVPPNREGRRCSEQRRGADHAVRPSEVDVAERRIAHHLQPTASEAVRDGASQKRGPDSELLADLEHVDSARTVLAAIEAEDELLRLEVRRDAQRILEPVE